VAITVDAFGQAFVQPQTKDEDVAENVFLPADRHTLLKLSDAKRLLAEGRFGEAVRCLDAILEGPEDFFFQPDKTSPIHRSLKTEAQRMISQIPREGREVYELQFGARARRMLDDALAAGDIAAVAEVSRRFFHTKSGYQATFLLGLDHFDRGRPLAGALTLQRLREAGATVDDLEPGLSLTTAACWLQAGVPEKARESLVALRQRQPSLRVAVGGREVPIFTDDAVAVDWLTGLIGAFSVAGPTSADHWLMFRGNPARNATAPGGLPLLNLRWRVTGADNPLIGSRLEQLERWCADEGTPAIPALHPIVVDDVLVMRTTNSLLGVDFNTGKRIWEVADEDPADLATGVPSADLQTRQSMVISGIGQRLWGDMTYGTMSSDGRSVFTIGDLDFAFGPAGNILFRVGRIVGRKNVAAITNPNGEQVDVSNRLEAHDVRTGKLKWSLGGPAGENALRQADTFFLGPPLPLMGQLYVIGEIKGEVRLLALDAATGNLLWSQQLAMVEQVVQDPLRRVAGVSPSYSDGILVCPTSTGAVVAIDLATRSLLWGYRYGQDRNRSRRNNGLMLSLSSNATAPSRWVDTSVSVVEGRALITPIESEWLYCLSLIDGKELWRAPRQADLYVACADHDIVVLVGRQAVHALRLADGKPAWKNRTLELPNGSVPSGRGFLADDRYYLPLSTAEVASIDVAAGKIVQVAKSRKGTIPGNLVCYRGKVISQGLDGVEEYYQLDAVRQDLERRLAANADDADALSLRGETLLDAGKRSEAVAAFRRAYELQPNPHTRELLRESLLEGLRDEFAAYRDRGPEIESLLDDTGQRATYLRQMADGLRQSGQWAAAFDHYQKLADLEPRQLPMDSVSKTLAVRRDRWFQGQLAALRSEAKDDAPARIDTAVQSRLKDAMAAGSVDALQRFIDYFGNQPGVASARNDLVQKLNAAGRPLDAELTLRKESSNGTPSPTPIARDAERQPAERAASWPTGQVEKSLQRTKNPAGNGYGRYVIELRGDPGPYMADVSLHFDDGRHLLVATDGWGRLKWQVSLVTDGQRQSFGFNRAWTYASAQNHLLLVVLGWKIIAVDTLGSGPNGTARILWTQDLMGSGVDMAGSPGLPWAMPNQPWLWQQQYGHVSDRSRLVGPITNDYVCFQRLRNLVAVDPRNGQVLWTRSDVPPGSDVFGDEEYVFVLAPNREEAVVLRAMDGQQVGTRRVPRTGNARQQVARVAIDGEQKRQFAHIEDYCLATLGRQMLLWWPEGDKRVLTLVDPLDGRDLWPGQSFPNSAHTDVVNHEAVGVMQPNGRFVLMSLPEGRTIADVQLEPDPSLVDMTLLASDGQYFLLTRSSPRAGTPQRPIQQTPGCDTKPIHRGRLYAFDRQGKLMWPAPVTIENQFLLLDQPTHLPLLTFASIMYYPRDNGAGRQKMSVLSIDKRNGRVAYKASLPNSIGMLDISGDPQKKTIDLVMQRDTVRLTFTDKPWSVPSATETKPKKPSGLAKELGDLWKSVQETFGIEADDAEGEE
jgi:outer membrane protein assembly factor BamB